MASEVFAFDATIPAATPIAAPVTVPVYFDPADVEQIDVKIPPGPSGLMGFQLWVKGGQVLPRQQGRYIVTDDQEITWRLTDLPDTGSWEVHGYNTDIYDHTIEVTFSVTPVGAVTPASAAAAASTAADVNLQIAGG